jgi:hypothetical protein
LEWVQTVNAAAAFIALCIGGTWAYIKIRKRREHFPRVEFTVDVSFAGLQKGQWVIEVLAFVDNKGLVRHLIREFAFDLRYISHDDALEEGGESIGHQIRIPHLVKKGTWVPETWAASFIEPGLATRYSYIAAIPRDASFVLLHGKFSYEGGKYFHTADRLIKVPKEPCEVTE